MSARDDYRAVYLMQHSPDANKAFADQINAALDEIDRLREQLDAAYHQLARLQLRTGQR